jgi:hypothetical protein
MLTDRTTASIVEAIVSMTRILGLSVLAEGVESPEQFEFLRALGLRHGARLLCKPGGAGRRVRGNAARLRATLVRAAPAARARVLAHDDTFRSALGNDPKSEAIRLSAKWIDSCESAAHAERRLPRFCAVGAARGVRHQHG